MVIGWMIRRIGSTGGLVRNVSSRLVHVQAHDCDGALHHLPLGAGKLDWDDVASGLPGAGYAGGACLELNPDPAIPE